MSLCTLASRPTTTSSLGLLAAGCLVLCSGIGLSAFGQSSALLPARSGLRPTSSSPVAHTPLRTAKLAANDARKQARLAATAVPGAFPSSAAAVATTPSSGARGTLIPAIIPAEPVTSAANTISPATASFGTIAVGGTSAIKTFTVTLATGGTIAAPVVLTQGSSGQDYLDAGTGTCTTNGTSFTYAANATCTVNVVLKGIHPGMRLGALEILSSNKSTVLASAFLTGTASGPLATFDPATVPLHPITMSNYGDALAMDAAGDVFVANTGAGIVQEYVAVNGVVSSASTIKTIGSGFSAPAGIAVDGYGNVWVWEAGGANADGNLYELLAVGGVLSTTSPQVTFTTTFEAGYTAGLTFDPSGNLWFAALVDDNTGQGGLDEFTATNGVIASGTAAVDQVDMDCPAGVGSDSSGNIYVSDICDQVVFQFISTSGVLTSYNQLTPTFSQNYGLAIEASGGVLVTDTTNGALYEIPYTGGAYASSARTLATGFTRPRFPAVDFSGNVTVVDTSTSTIDVLTFPTPPALGFPTTAVSASSATQTVAVENVGNIALTLPVPSSGQNPSLSKYFTLSNTSTCPLVSSTSSAGTLASGANCNEVLSYNPTLAGSVSGTLILTDNNLNAAGSTQTIPLTSSTITGLTVTVVGQNVPVGTASITLEFSVGYGANTRPTATPTLKVNASSTNVGAVACTAKSGHLNCTATYNPSALSTGAYTILATQPADSTYTTPTTATGTLTITSH